MPTRIISPVIARSSAIIGVAIHGGICAAQHEDDPLSSYLNIEKGGQFALILGAPYADNYGRRPGLIASVVTFPLFTMAAAVVRGWSDMLLLQLLAGLGLGGVQGLCPRW